jgi:hypothetical protein
LDSCDEIEINFALNEEPCGKPQGINVHMPTTTAATLWQATGYSQDKRPYRQRCSNCGKSILIGKISSK